jgi:hypothetical protein
MGGTATDAEPDDAAPRSTVWLWDAGQYLGVTGDKTQARIAAEEHIAENGTARIELALIRFRAYSSAHERTGLGDIAVSYGHVIRWLPIPPEPGQ